MFYFIYLKGSIECKANCISIPQKDYKEETRCPTTYPMVNNSPVVTGF